MSVLRPEQFDYTCVSIQDVQLAQVLIEERFLRLSNDIFVHVSRSCMNGTETTTLQSQRDSSLPLMSNQCVIPSRSQLPLWEGCPHRRVSYCSTVAVFGGKRSEEIYIINKDVHMIVYYDVCIIGEYLSNVYVSSRSEPNVPEYVDTKKNGNASHFENLVGINGLGYFSRFLLLFVTSSHDPDNNTSAPGWEVCSGVLDLYAMMLKCNSAEVDELLEKNILSHSDFDYVTGIFSSLRANGILNLFVLLSQWKEWLTLF